MNSVTVNRLGVRLVCALAACLGVAAPAAAQRPTGGAFTGLFRGSPREQPHTLDFHMSGFTGWDDNLLTTGPFAPTVGSGLIGDGSDRPTRGISNGGQASLTYGFRRAGTRSQVMVGAGASVLAISTSLRDKPLWLQSYAVSTGFTTNLTGRTSVSVMGSASYAPYYQYAPFLRSTASEESPAGTDYGFAVDSEWVQTRSVGASLSHRLTKTSTITVGTGRTESVVAGKKNVGDVGAGLVNVNYTHSLTRKLALRVGYALGRSTYGNNISTIGTSTPTDTSASTESTTPPAASTSADTSEKSALTHNLDIGLGYGDGITLSLGRHYVLSLGVGTAITKNGDAKSVALTGKATAFTVTGNATLSRSIGRTWGTSLAYVRGTSYVVGFSQQLVSDSANLGIGGPIGRRVEFSAGAGASRGLLLFESSGDPIITYMASSRLSYALFSHLGLYGQASYYRNTLPSGFRTLGLLPNLDRRTLIVGVSTWLPLIKHQRARSDSGTQTAGQP